MLKRIQFASVLQILQSDGNLLQIWFKEDEPQYRPGWARRSRRYSLLNFFVMLSSIFVDFDHIDLLVHNHRLSGKKHDVTNPLPQSKQPARFSYLQRNTILPTVCCNYGWKPALLEHKHNSIIFHNSDWLC